ncbi:MAG: hypothetical protein RI894_1895 [Bacteroidota bacterium]|jgi:uncharacterized protein YecT (DUF1311 family)
MKKLSLIAIFLATFLAASFAQTQAELNQTSAAEYKVADKQLNLVYNKVVKVADAQSKAALLEAEKAWIKYRDLHCKYACMQYDGGSIYPLMYNSCLTEMTKQRTKELTALLDDQH